MMSVCGDSHARFAATTVPNGKGNLLRVGQLEFEPNIESEIGTDLVPRVLHAVPEARRRRWQEAYVVRRTRRRGPNTPSSIMEPAPDSRPFREVYMIATNTSRRLTNSRHARMQMLKGRRGAKPTADAIGRA